MNGPEMTAKTLREVTTCTTVVLAVVLNACMNRIWNDYSNSHSIIFTYTDIVRQNRDAPPCDCLSAKRTLELQQTPTISCM